MADIFKKIQQDVRVALTDEFDKNFQRKAFFNRPWKVTRTNNNRGSVLLRTGSLRRSIISRLEGNAIKWRSNVPYANIHNKGGRIKVTQKMKSYFWAMYYKSGGAAAKASGNRKSILSAQANTWKALALKKVGSFITIDQRQFIGNHPEVSRVIKMVFQSNLNAIDLFVKQKMKR